MRWPSFGLIASLLLWVVLPAPAAADSWEPPTTTTVESPDRQHRFTMTPRALSSSLAYFEDAVKGKARPGQQKGQAAAARGRLERRAEGGRWTTIWDKPLVNDVAPVDVIIDPSGRTVATLDNWHFTGHGDHVVVLYGSDGALLRSLKLTDVLPEYYIKSLPHSVSSIRWRKDARFAADGRLIIPIVPPTDDWSDTSQTVELTIDPVSGVIAPVSPEQWSTALETARRVAADKDDHERKRRAAFIAPLVRPTTIKEQDWHVYLTEAFYRLDPDWDENTADVEVLRSPSAADYKPSVGWLRDTLLEKEMEADRVMIASPASPDNLIAELATIVRAMRPRQLKAATIYVVGPPTHRERLLAVLAVTGAKLIYLDPAVPIPQRPERLARSGYAGP